ncbi:MULTISPECIES: hypothetical protein [Pseudomonas]|uniref:Uncharacterized protein n=1 Tax=Pseudomonas luteola TaxID=47886 RepID=A0A2X2BUL3_PSELU|nr:MULTISPECIES: hypothetical protein [Pseudomonas]MBA1250243.1 hypothetical protein [Pseudomonas zeshuii]MBH3441767.1 hypothetical protein [Pseudomonas luteola]SPY99896.1 Uncharacterised protein [Pseudomonas luteola]SPZ00072.1 Uncharacterised protein [Pseudomonas luteola]
MKAQPVLFRRMVRFPVIRNESDADFWLIRRLEQLEADNGSYRLQEWIRNAMRNEFHREMNITEGLSKQLAEFHVHQLSHKDAE